MSEKIAFIIIMCSFGINILTLLSWLLDPQPTEEYSKQINSILKELLKKKEGLGIVELAVNNNLSLETTQRIIKRLEKKGFISKDYLLDEDIHTVYRLK